MDNKIFTAGDFAKYSRITRSTLHHYDKIGVLSPMSRGDNRYRHYSSAQLSIVNVIRTLQELGLSLTDIKALKDNRTPATVKGTLMSRIGDIDIKINEWVRARKLLFTLLKTIDSAADVDERKVSIVDMPAEAISLGELNDYSNGRNDYDALFSFYRDMSKKYPDLDMNYPVWGMFSQDRIKRGDWKWPDRYYFYNPDGYDRKPAARYAVGYVRGGYGKCGNLYKRIIDFIGKNDLEICGDAFEEYPLNELCFHNENDYLIRVMVTVREKK